ncbi:MULTISPECIES: ATP-binding cassette domain-containing protein [Terrabacteria group]|uniref:ATP-binding cassette domain-containing protein n=1 Tax=Bacillati TaxID=1783272 RepID=UPI00193A78A5|nr:MULTISPECIES: ABC transporter ATP-binding protein [Terrabacteria group]MBW9211961.1 ABC transporter ATP-binding protein [Trueperella sp. zg.1013]QRG87239.1 ABC transporter ATP-binding protein [Bulleidia sp. zg-1006]
MNLVVQDAKKSFGDLLVFKNINLTFETGKFYLIKGRNGSGKTVFLKTLCGYYSLDDGSIYQDGVRIRDKINYIENAGIVIENPKFLSHLTLIENLRLLKTMSDKVDEQAIKKWIDFYDLTDYKNTKYKHCSLGTKQKMSLIQAFIHNPKVLILDEPFNALDTHSIEKTQKYFNDIKQDTITILSTHIDDNLRYISDYEFIFDDEFLLQTT